ncbi:MAG: serine hydrolase [Desulfobacterales bacterium]
MRKNNVRIPFGLLPGDKIAILAPASPFDKEKFSRGIKILKSMGFETFIPPGLFASNGYLAGDDIHRAGLLNEIFRLPDIKAVMCARGGYGSARILEKIDYGHVGKNPKIFIGFSDLTALLTTFYEKCHMVTFHGPTVASLADACPETIEGLFSVLTSQKVVSLFEPKATVIKSGLAKGRVIGGNLTTLCHLLGTPFEPSFNGHILFLEDCKEALYRIDRMLNHMKMAGCFEKLSGLILGDFSECGKQVELIQVFEDHFSDFKFPILAGIGVGHKKTNITLPIGIDATLNADEKYLCYHLPPTISQYDKAFSVIFSRKNLSRCQQQKTFFVHFNGYNEIDKLMKRAISDFVFPGAVLLFSKNGSVHFHKAYGISNVFTNNPVVPDTIFDLASLTKPLAAATSIMALITDKMLVIEDSLSGLLTEFESSDKKDIRIDHLLTHTAGLPDYHPFFEHLEKFPANERKAKLRQLLLNVPLKNEVGKKTLYSDLGFMMLEWVIGCLAGCSIDRYVKHKVFDPLGLSNLFYQNVHEKRKRSDYAATEICPWRKTLIEGIVHDENAFAVGGIGAHAGLFGTAQDIYRLLKHLLLIYSDSSFKGLFSSELVKKFLLKYDGLDRTLGFDTPSQNRSSSGSLFSDQSVGHLGFTGTSFWIDLQRSIIVILLTNRVHPDRNNQKLRNFRPVLHDAIMYRL